jgi:hypothetical protein
VWQLGWARPHPPPHSGSGPASIRPVRQHTTAALLPPTCVPPQPLALVRGHRLQGEMLTVERAHRACLIPHGPACTYPTLADTEILHGPASYYTAARLSARPPLPQQACPFVNPNRRAPPRLQLQHAEKNATSV